MGKEIIIGWDNILSTGIEMYYSYELTHCLNSQGNFYFDQAIRKWLGITPVWKRENEIGLMGEMVGAWKNILEELHSSGICKVSHGDQIGWDGNVKR